MRIRFALMMPGALVVAMVTAMPFAAMAETVYRYRDAQGNVVYSQTAPEGVEAEVIELPPPPPGEAAEDLDARVRRQLEVARELEDSRRQREADRAEQRAAEAARQPPVLQQPAGNDESGYVWPYYPPYPPHPGHPGHPPGPGHPIEPPPPQKPPPSRPPAWPLQ